MELLKILFIALLSNIVNGFNHAKCVLLSNQKYMIQLTLINLHLNEYSQEFHYYPFLVKLNRSLESCAINDLSDKLWVPNKTKDLNLNEFNMVAGTSELKILTKHISCKCKCKFYGGKWNLDQWWNYDKCRCECNKQHVCKKNLESCYI